MGLFKKQPTDDEYLSQTSNDIFDVASDGTYLAVGILTHLHNCANLSRDETEAFVQNIENNALLKVTLQFLCTYSDWRMLGLPEPYRRALERMEQEG